MSKWCNNLFPDIHQRLKRATEFYVNILSDAEPNEREDFNNFGQLLIEGEKSPTQFYCVMVVPSENNTVKIAYSEMCDSADDLENWLHTVDGLAAKNFPQLRFKGFTGGYSRVNNELAIEACFYNKPAPRTVSSYKVVA